MLTVFTELTEKPPWEGLKREQNAILREAHEEQGRHWAEHMLPRHFSPRAGVIYGYQPRKDSTIRRKLRLAKVGQVLLGGRVDLVWSGLLAAAVLQHQTVTPTASSVTVRMFGPTYLHAFDKRKNQPNKADEIRAVTAEETLELEHVLDAAYSKDVKDFRESKTTKFGGP